MVKENKKPQCPFCQGEEFDVEEGKIDTKWGMFAHKVKILICKNCGYVLFFSKGKSIWDFD